VKKALRGSEGRGNARCRARARVCFALCTALCTGIVGALGLAPEARAGGRLDVLAETGIELQPGIDVAVTVPIFWDERCARVEYTLDTVPPNAGTPAELSIADVRRELQAAMDVWNQIPTSYIEMNITRVRTIGNGVRGFDFVNEITFEAPPDFDSGATSPSISLDADTQFEPGDDLDGDGDSDVYDPIERGRNTCFDADLDGDIEFPAGLYLAGTILDNDVQFNPRVLYELTPSPDAVDLRATATHEFGHSHGLSHALLNNISDRDGSASTMFPSLDAGDPGSESAARSLHVDDIAWSSLIYPEGSGDGPLASLQFGDVPFSEVFSVLRGSVVSAAGIGIAGANVYARRIGAENEIPVGAFAGRVRVLRDLATGQIGVLPPELGVVDGEYELPLPDGNYEIFVQPPDVEMATGMSISAVGTIGQVSDLHFFDEEGASTPGNEVVFETNPGRSRHVAVRTTNPLERIDFVANQTIQFANFGPVLQRGSPIVLGQQDVRYATRYRNDIVLAVLDSGTALTTGQFLVSNSDPSIPVRIARASLVLGRLTPEGTIALIDQGLRLREQSDFVAQDGDFHPFYFDGANGMSDRIQSELARDPSLDLFLVVDMPNDPELGASGIPPLLTVGLDESLSESFVSLGGSPFFRLANQNWGMLLNFSPR